MSFLKFKIASDFKDRRPKSSIIIMIGSSNIAINIYKKLSTSLHISSRSNENKRSEWEICPQICGLIFI